MSLVYALLALVALVFVVELVARAVGLGTPLLFERTSYGYRIQPSQEFRFFGRHSLYNEYGMRSAQVAAMPAPGRVRILCVGDSITNGGVITDQQETYPHVLQSRLAGHYGEIEVLNISAGGWALENEGGWLAEHGVKGSHLVILQVATHDMHQRMAEGSVLDTNPGFPSRPPSLASTYLMKRYVLPRLGLRPKFQDPGVASQPYSSADIDRSVAVLDRIADRVEEEGSRLMILHVAQPFPLEPVSELAVAAKARLRDWANRRGTTLVSVEKTMNEAGGTALFRDSIHPSSRGMQVIAEALVAPVRSELAAASVKATVRKVE